MRPLYAYRLAGRPWFEARRRGDRYDLTWHRSARAVLSSRGGLLSFERVAGAPAISLRITRRMVRAYAGSLAGRETLHATCLLAPGGGRAVAFLGKSGRGKSTLARALMRRGWRLLSDDMLRLRFMRGRAYPVAAAAFLKYRKTEAWRPGNGRALFDPNLEKHIVIFPARAGKPRALSALMVLERGRRDRAIEFKKVVGPEKCARLLGHLYNSLLRPPHVARNQFAWCGRLAESVDLFRLCYPSGLSRLSRVSQAIESGLDRGWKT